MLLMIGCFSWKDGWNFKNNFEIIFRHDVKAMTNDEKRECNAAVVCYSIKKFNHKIKDFIKVKERSLSLHTEIYEGAAHLSHNLQCKEHSYIPVLAHNSFGYDNR